MKKLFMAIMLILICTTSAAVYAAENEQPQNPMSWEISMMPKPTAEEIEAARWSIITENDIGIYAYDIDSLQFAVNTDGSSDKNIVTAEVKTIFTNKDILKKLKKDYSKNLEKKERVLYCKMKMHYNLQNSTYCVKNMTVYTDKDRVIEEKISNTFAPVPEVSFAEALYEICLKFAADSTGKSAETGLQ